MAIDFQALLDIARVNEEEVTDEQFNMFDWKCGTVGCMIGNWCSTSTTSRMEIVDGMPTFSGRRSMDAVQARLGLSLVEAVFLFGRAFHVADWYRTRHCAGDRRNHTIQSRADNIRRLRKFIWWKLRKAEIFADYETARHQEGNWNVASYTLEMSEV